VHERYLQNLTPTPYLSVTLVSYGLLVPFALWGAARRLRDRSRASLLLVVWFVVHALLLYAPVLFQRRLTQGFEFPLILLALDGLLALRTILLRTRMGAGFLVGAGAGPIMAFLLLMGFGMSTANVFGSELQLVLYPKSKSIGDAVYLPQDQVAAYRWIHANSTDADVSLALPFDGLFAAGLSGRRTYIGHGIETLHSSDKAAAAQKFFGQISGNERLAFLHASGITLVIETPLERSNEAAPLSRESFLSPVFRGPTITVYRVTEG